MVTQKRIQELLDYNPLTGAFAWRRGAKRYGKTVGTNGNGYIRVQIDKKTYYLHKLAWLYIYGYIPVGVIDHIDGIKTDNRIVNLRNIKKREDCLNRKIHRNGRKAGCYFDMGKKKWTAQIRIGDRRKTIGRYDTEEEASLAYYQKLDQIIGHPQNFTEIAIPC